MTTQVPGRTAGGPLAWLAAAAIPLLGSACRRVCTFFENDELEQTLVTVHEGEAR